MKKNGNRYERITKELRSVVEGFGVDNYVLMKLHFLIKINSKFKFLKFGNTEIEKLDFGRI